MKLQHHTEVAKAAGQRTVSAAPRAPAVQRRAAKPVHATPPDGVGAPSAPSSSPVLPPSADWDVFRNRQSNIVAAPASLTKKETKEAKKAPMDGNEAAATIAYALSEVSFIYPITPSTTMGELADTWATEGKKNIWGNNLSVFEMESETGAAGAVHGALCAGALATTFTCSQGLLLMIPNMYKIAGELMPCVLHVTARALAKHALSIFGDHQDVMAVRQTGWGMLCSHSVQEAHDMALVAHLATLRSSIPFVHFFDGFRTSHEINKISVISEDQIRQIIEHPTYEMAIRHHRQRALNPTHPHQRGTAQGPDVYMQYAEACNPFYDNGAAHVTAALEEVGELTGRKYKLFDYVGHPQAERVIVAMGSGTQIVEEAVNLMLSKGEKVGVLKVRLYRPWSSEALLAVLPESVKKIAVLDRTKESGSLGEPLYLDVVTALAEAGWLAGRTVIGGRYGLASKDFTPAMAVSVFDHLKQDKPRNKFTVGIVDDVTHTSLPLTPPINTLPTGTQQCMFWGMGSDGTVGANKEAIKILSDNTPLYTQAYFEYDAHKSGGVTISHLRFGPSPITASYVVEQADYSAVSMQSYMQKYDIVSKIRPGGTLLINTVFTDLMGDKAARKIGLDDFLPLTVKRELAERDIQLYVIDARAVADTIGLGKHINMIMQTCFFGLSGILPLDKAISLLKKSIEKAYSKKGPEVVKKNHAGVDAAMASLKKIEIPASWKAIETPQLASRAMAEKAATISDSRERFIEEVAKPMLALEGNRLPVSIFPPQGFVPPGTTVIERRAIAATVPIWKAENCTQCNLCSFVCPHAAIRPFLATDAELASAPSTYNTIQAKGPGLGDYKYRMQVTPYDCTGCQLCVHICPDNALESKPTSNVLSIEDTHWSFSTSLPERKDVMDRATVKGSQFMKPLMEFSGACEGCGETGYVKMLTQEFGDRLIIANATGCSSIWGGSAPSNPYTTDADGFGPAWANSLFEDNAQFGLGIAMATVQRRKNLHRNVTEAVAAGDESGISLETRKGLELWLADWQTAKVANPIAKGLVAAIEKERTAHPEGKAPRALERLYHGRDLLHKPSIWIVGGDGWAYDIGFGGLDHVLSTGEDVNILVLDTEMYSNTGGQKSKSTPLGAVTKFATGGKTRPKKDMGAIAMGYGDVYVASTCLNSNPTQYMKALQEAEAHKGVSLILAYSPCAMHGIEGGMCSAVDDAREAVETGYWPLYRFNPSVDEAAGKKRFMLDSKRLKGDLDHFLHHEVRFNQLERKAADTAVRLHHDLDVMNKERYDRLKQFSEGSAMGAPHGVEQIEEAEHRAHLLEEAEAERRAMEGVAQRSMDNPQPLPERLGPGGGFGGKPSHFT